MGYAGKWQERQRARELRALSWTLQEIATELGVAKASVSVWVRDVDFTPKPRNRGHRSHRPHPMTLRKQAELARCAEEAAHLVGRVDDRDLLMYALGLYAGEGAKGRSGLLFANSDPRLVVVFLTWLRRQFVLDEDKLRVRLYLHADLDLDAAIEFWSAMTDIPAAQFNKPYRAIPDATIRSNRHVHGCVGIAVHSTLLQRRVLALIEAVTSRVTDPG